MTTPLITMLGDSLTAGYGLRRAEALPPRLQAEMATLGRPCVMVNAGVSGDTTADGLRRLDRDVPLQTTLCVVALGANDMMQMIPVDRVRANLDAILERLTEKGIAALLCGMRAPPWLGAYAFAFDAVFRDVAARHGAAFDPFLLEGVALDPRYALADRIHPNADGVARIARRLAPRVVAALARARDPME